MTVELFKLLFAIYKNLRAKLNYLILSMFVKNFHERLMNASKLHRQVQSSTAGRISHFFNSEGERIRGWQPNRYQFQTERNHLIARYGWSK